MPNIPTLLATTFVLFVSSEFRWLRLVARNRYPQCDGVIEVGKLDEGGWLTVGVGDGLGDCTNYLKREWDEKKVELQEKEAQKN